MPCSEFNKNYHENQKTIERPIYLSNDLCQIANWNLENVHELRIFSLLAEKISSVDEDLKRYEIPVRDLFLTKRRLSDKDYKEAEAAATNMLRRVVELAPSGEYRWRRYSLLINASYKIIKGSAFLDIQFHPDLRDFLLNITSAGEFAILDLLELLKLRKQNSQRMYLLLCSWRGAPCFYLSVPELHQIFSAPVSYKANFKDFRRHILEPTNKEINEKTNVKWFWIPKYDRGDHVEGINFFFGNKDSQELKAAQNRAARKLAIIHGINIGKLSVREMEILKARDENIKKNNRIAKDAYDCCKSQGLLGIEVENICAKEKSKSRNCIYCRKYLRVRNILATLTPPSEEIETEYIPPAPGVESASLKFRGIVGGKV